MIVTRNNTRCSRQSSKDSSSDSRSSTFFTSQRDNPHENTSENNNMQQLYTLRNSSQNNNQNNANLNYLLYEIPEQYSSSMSTNSDLISTRSTKKKSNENKIKIVIKNADDNPFNKNPSIFKSNYQINFNSSNTNYNNNKRVQLYSSNSSNSLSQKSRNSSKQSVSPNSVYSPQLNKTSTEITPISNSEISARNVEEPLDDQWSLKNNSSFLDLISSLNEDKSINNTNYKSNISKQLRINQKMSQLKTNIDRKDVFSNDNERYFYSAIKFVNDEINQQFINLKKQTLTDVGPGPKSKFVTNKYNKTILKTSFDTPKTTDLEAEEDLDLVTVDLLTKLSERVWKEAETL